jgi:valyl-tRNA synthetase
MSELAPQYNPKEVEERRYKQWEQAGAFNADVDPKRKPYTIVIPPPNVTAMR